MREPESGPPGQDLGHLLEIGHEPAHGSPPGSGWVRIRGLTRRSLRSIDALRRGVEPASIGTTIPRIERDPGPGARAVVERYRRLVRARNELRYLGSTPSGHPLAILRPRAASEGCRTIATILASPRAAEVRIAALPAATRRIDTSRGPFRFVTWEDETGLLEGELGAAACSTPFEACRAYRVQGRVRRRASGPVLQVRELTPLSGSARASRRHAR